MQMQKTPKAPLQRFGFSVQEAAEMVGLSRATLYRLIDGRRVATVKIGSRRLVPLHAIKKLMGEK